MSDEKPTIPHLTVVAGNPTPDEIAIVTALVSRRGGATEEASQFSLWARKSRNIRPALRPGYGAWRASTMPR
jgi:hypothetical protein